MEVAKRASKAVHSVEKCIVCIVCIELGLFDNRQFIQEELQSRYLAF